jgi:8-amino-7-oxononanoate synthase
MNWSSWASDELDTLALSNRLRAVRDFDGRGVVFKVDGHEVVSFASNDYLGLGTHPDVVNGARRALERWGTGAGAARLIVGSRPVHSTLESEIAAWKHAQGAVLFPTGYAANLGVLQAFGSSSTTICSDELNHASIIDGCRLARARIAVYPHVNLGALEEQLRATSSAIVVTDHIFSMDGDAAPLEEIARLCERHRALLVIDEAHAVLASEPNLGRAEVIRVGTLSKFLGALGGFAAGPRELMDLLVNRARSFIFTTASSPPDAGAALAALQVFISNEGDSLRLRLRNTVDQLIPDHPSPIVPIVLGDERIALDASEELLSRGLFIPAIRPPSVPNGSSRLRVALSSLHTDAHIDALKTAVAEFTETVHA